MPYKDRDKQREAIRLATRRYRTRLNGITPEADTVIPVIPWAGELTKAKQVK